MNKLIYILMGIAVAILFFMRSGGTGPFKEYF